MSGPPVRQLVEAVKQKGRGSVCCLMDPEAPAFFALERQRRNQNVMKTNARVGKICKVVIMPINDNMFLSELIILISFSILQSLVRGLYGVNAVFRVMEESANDLGSVVYLYPIFPLTH